MGKAVNDLRKCSSKQISLLAKTLIEYEICVSFIHYCLNYSLYFMTLLESMMIGGYGLCTSSVEIS